MSNAVYPTLPGLSFSVQRTVQAPPVQIRTTPSRREYRARDATLTLYAYSLAYEFLRSASSWAELQTLVGFFNSVGGPLDSFLFIDPDDCLASNQAFGVGDNVTTAFQLSRAYGGFYEPVYALNGVPVVTVNGVTKYGYARSNLALYTADDATATGHTWWSRYTTAANPFAAVNTTQAVHGWATGAGITSGPPAGFASTANQDLFQYQFDCTDGGRAMVKTSAVALTAGVTYVLSAWVWGVGSSAQSIQFSIADNAPANFAVVNGAWQRLSVSWTCTSSGSYPGYIGSTILFGGTTTTSNVVLAGVQIEPAPGVPPIPSPFMPTEAAPVSIAADFSANLATGIVTFGTAPASAAQLAWTGYFYRRVRFKGDTLDTSKFMQDLWEAKKVELQSVPG